MKGKKLIILGEHHLCNSCVSEEISKIKKFEDKIDVIGLEIIDLKKKNLDLCANFNKIGIDEMIENIIENNFPLCNKEEMYAMLEIHRPLFEYITDVNKKIYPLGNPFARDHATSLIKAIDLSLKNCEKGLIAIIGFGDIICDYSQFAKKYRCTIVDLHQRHLKIK